MKYMTTVVKSVALLTINSLAIQIYLMTPAQQTMAVPPNDIELGRAWYKPTYTHKLPTSIKEDIEESSTGYGARGNAASHHIRRDIYIP